jgi:hypothetical protein
VCNVVLVRISGTSDSWPCKGVDYAIDPVSQSLMMLSQQSNLTMNKCWLDAEHRCVADPGETLWRHHFQYDFFFQTPSSITIRTCYHCDLFPCVSIPQPFIPGSALATDKSISLVVLAAWIAEP